MKAIKNVKIYDYNQYIDSGYVLFDEKILGVGKMEDFHFKGETIDGQNKLLLPGLVNGHTHIYSTLFRGLALPFAPESFQDILDQLWWKFDKELTLEDIYVSALIYGIESLKNGVTTIIDHHASGVIEESLSTLKRAIEETLGMRGIYAFETSDRYEVDRCISENLEFLTHASGLFGLHASMSLSKATLEKVSEQNKYPIHIHVAESQEDESKSVVQYGKYVVERLETHRLLKEDSILAHCVHINQQEAEILEGQKVWIAINPSSNLNNNVGIFNYDLLKAHHLKIIIGTDGFGSNVAKELYNFNLLAKKSLNSPVGISQRELIQIINNTYQAASNLRHQTIGKIKKNAVADFMLVDYKAPTEMTSDTIFSHVLYGVFERCVPEKVWVKGRLKIDRYKMRFDERPIYEKSKELSEKLWERIKES